ncbi:hypothetical protein [Herbiconiux sp. UC225_62]|uniref:hypothetical protein n=1 Tax=Herbiconiux sp. UC225_62 TaxID=3350168 RepID=UPI0036D3A870
MTGAVVSGAVVAGAVVSGAVVAGAVVCGPVVAGADGVTVASDPVDVPACVPDGA